MVLADFVLLALLVLSFYGGWRTGTIKVVAGIGSLILGYDLARKYSTDFAVYVTEAMPVLTPSGQGNDFMDLLYVFIDTNAVANRIVQVLAFAIIFTVVVFLVKKFAHFFDGIFRGTFLGFINSFLGALCSLALFVLAFNIVMNYFFPVFNDNSLLAQAESFIRQSKMILPFISDSTTLLMENTPLALYKNHLKI
ncbi:MAG: CvpA family protein [Clostridiales bacterium]